MNAEQRPALIILLKIRLHHFDLPTFYFTRDSTNIIQFLIGFIHIFIQFLVFKNKRLIGLKNVITLNLDARISFERNKFLVMTGRNDGHFCLTLTLRNWVLLTFNAIYYWWCKKEVKIEYFSEQCCVLHIYHVYSIHDCIGTKCLVCRLHSICDPCFVYYIGLLPFMSFV